MKLTTKKLRELYDGNTKKPALLKTGADWLILTSILLLISAHFMTNYYIAKNTSIAETLQINAKAVTIMERNPLAKLAFEMGNIAAIGNLILAPALMTALYLIIRKTSGTLTTDFTATTFFFVTLLDALNDLSILIGSGWLL